MTTAIRHAVDGLQQLLEPLTVDERYAVLCDAVSFQPAFGFQLDSDVGRARAILADIWEQRTGRPVPLEALLQLTHARKSCVQLQLWNLVEAREPSRFHEAVVQLVCLLDRLTASCLGRQRPLFGVTAPDDTSPDAASNIGGAAVWGLNSLVKAGKQFRTIYADPPWPYDNEAARGAAINHYPVMSLDDIHREPVGALAADDAHLHLWTTNGFLREALELIEAWGFQYKSCFLWIKPDIGCGNYWRVSHEFLLLGVRGKLPFSDRTQPSWCMAPRLEHSRKPGRVRLLIERVSPRPLSGTVRTVCHSEFGMDGLRQSSRTSVVLTIPSARCHAAPIS